jgi:hypothetical protein
MSQTSSGLKSKSSKKLACCLFHVDFLLDLPFYPEDGDDIFLRNIDFYRTTRRFIAEDRDLHSDHYKRLKSK